MRVRNEAAKLLHRHGIRPGGSELDRLRRGRANIILLISEINTEVNKLVGKESGSRSELSQGELDNIDLNFSSIVEGAWSKLKNGN